MQKKRCSVGVWSGWKVSLVSVIIAQVQRLVIHDTGNKVVHMFFPT